MIKIDEALIRKVSQTAKESSRKRKNYNFHELPEDILQRFLNAWEPGTYLQPHKHENPDKNEVFICLTGKFLIIEFDREGNINDYMILDSGQGNYGAEIAPRVFHTVICLEPDSVAYELKEGPYDPNDDKNFASWAPKEGEAGCEEYNQKILNELNIQIS